MATILRSPHEPCQELENKGLTTIPPELSIKPMRRIMLPVVWIASVTAMAFGAVATRAWASAAREAAQPQGPDGAKAYEDRCAVCHGKNDPRTPTVEALKPRSVDEIVAALTTGKMREQ